MGPAGVSAAVDLTPSISREITYKHDTHLKKHLQVSENPHWVTTALHEWPSKVKRKNIPKKSANVALFPSRSWSISTFICLLICLLQSSDEYENEMSILSVTSFYRQSGQLNFHLIIITKEQQKDKGTQEIFLGPHVLSCNVPKGSVPSTHGFGRSTSTACAFQQDRDCVRFTTCATLPKITQIVPPQMYTVLPKQELGRNN